MPRTASAACRSQDRLRLELTGCRGLPRPPRRRRVGAMTLTLYFHPLASFCHKALIALDEARPRLRAGRRRPRRPGLPRRLRRGLAAPQVPGPARLRPRRHRRRIDRRHRVSRRLPRLRHDPRRPRPRLAGADVGPHLRPATSTCRCRRSSPTPSAPTAGTTRTASPRPAPGSPTAYRFLETELPAAPWALGAEASASPTAPPRRRSSTPTWCSPSARPSRALKAYLDRLVRRPSYARVLADGRALLPDVPARPEARRCPPDGGGGEGTASTETGSRHFRRRCSDSRGMISTKLQGRCRASSCAARIPSQASRQAPGDPGSAKR